MSAIAERLTKAFHAHARGEHQFAAEGFQAVLAEDPGNVNALHLLGLTYLNSGRLAEADELIARALALRPDVAELHNNRGLCRMAQGRLAEAEADVTAAIGLKPAYPEAYNNLGLIAERLGRLADAERAFIRAIRLKPDFVAAFCNLAGTALCQGRADRAAACSRQALILQPGYAEAETTLGFALEQQGELNEAEACFRRAIATRPSARGWTALGRVLRQKGRTADAEPCLRAALELDPQFVEANRELGFVLLAQGRLTEADAAARGVFRADPESVATLQLVGRVLREQGRLKEAEMCSVRALRLDKENAESHLDLAGLHLLTGRWGTGWAGLEWRWRRRFAPRPAFEKPPWDGSALEGKTILLWCEPNIEDTIQFVRYAPLVKARGGRVVLRGPAELGWLLRSDFLGAERVSLEGEPLPTFDEHAPVSSLPRILGTRVETVPADVPYASHLEIPAATSLFWQKQIERFPGERVGVLWSAGAGRSVPPELFSPLSAVPGVSLIGLQKGDREVKSQCYVGDLGSGYDEGDWADAAAVLSALDLVICVDSPLAHLAGALGVPVWLAVPQVPPWRWLLDREDSPWYPTMRIFRQPAAGDWAAVFRRIGIELDRWGQGRRAGAGRRRQRRNEIDFFGGIALDNL